MATGTHPPEAPNPVHPEMSAEEVVKAKEKAVFKILETLDSISDKIGRTKASPNDIDLSIWDSTFKGIGVDFEGFFTYFGLCGDTGLGKTMLLNTLICDNEDIAPSSQQTACTAAVCCFQNHYPESGKEKYIAKISFKSKEAVEQEMASMFQEMNDLHVRVAMEGADEITRAEDVRFQEQIKVISGWSGFTPAKIRELGLAGLVNEITESCDSAKMLFNLTQPSTAKQLRITGDTASKFLREVTPFVGSVSNSKRGHIRWPLVELVRIWLPSLLLSRCPGLVLVDLPGQMDALDSRSQVAREYYDKLDKMLIVTPADRAQDNRTATELIYADQIYDMEASGKLDDDSIAVVISKVDQLDWMKYVNTEADEDSLSPSFISDRNLYEEKVEKLRELKENIVSLKAGENECTEPVSSQCTLKRVIQDSSQPSSELMIAMTKRHILEDEIKELFNRCLQACIQSRSKGSVESLQAYFDDVRNSSRQTEKASTILSVFPVSSKAQQDLVRTSPLPGFPDRTATGFAALENWIIAATLAQREKQADNILYRCKVAFDAIEEWAVDNGNISVQLPPTAKAGIERVLEEWNPSLREGFQRAETNLTSYIGKLEPYKGTKKETGDTVISSFPTLIDRFQNDIDGTKLHWSTYSACIRRKGLKFHTSRKPRKTHFWEGRMYGHYWAKRAHVWNHASIKRLSSHANNLASQAQKRVTHHLHTICKLDSLPLEYKEALQRVAYKVQNLVMEYQSKFLRATTVYLASVNHTRLHSRAVMSEPMKQGYIEASQHRGRGMGKKQIQTMHDFAVKKGEEIIKEIGTKISKQLQRHRKTYQNNYKKFNTELVDKIEAIQTQVIRQLCSGPRHTLGHTGEVKEFRASLLDDIKGWNEYWDLHGSKVGSVRIPPCDEKLLDNTPPAEEEKKPKRAAKGSRKPRNTGTKTKVKGNNAEGEEVEGEAPKDTEPEETGHATADEEECWRE